MTKQTIVITGNPTWAQNLMEQVSDNYAFIQIRQSAGYMTCLIEKQVALVLVNGDAEAWSSWITAPKVSPATRRIPILLISSDSSIREEVRNVGADFALSPQDLLAKPLVILHDFARQIDPALEAELDCDCQKALPELAKAGLRQFNVGAYYQQHDSFEALWVETTSPVRDLYQAVLQVGIAYYQIERGNYRGALKMLQRSVQWLVRLPDECQGINVKKLRDDSFHLRAVLEHLGEARLHELDKSLLKPVEWQER